MGGTARPSPVRVLKALLDLPELLATANFLKLRKGEVRRIPIPRTPVNKGKKKGQSFYAPALDNSLLGPPTCRGFGPPPKRSRCDGARSSIRLLPDGRYSSRASRFLPSGLLFSPRHGYR